MLYEHQKVVLASILASFAATTPQLARLDPTDAKGSWTPKGPTRKPKQGKPHPLRGYFTRYASSLHGYVAEKNLADIANGKTGFKGFRKVREFDRKLGGTRWVAV